MVLLHNGVISIYLLRDRVPDTHSNFIPSNKPVRHKRIVRVVQRRVVSHFGRASVRILPLCKELVDRIESVRLNGVVGGEDNKLRNIFL
jgi:hypothetical protein